MSLSNKRSDARESSPPAKRIKTTPSLSRSDDPNLSPAIPSSAAVQPLVNPPDPAHLRIWSWNIDGIAPFLQPSLDSFIKKPVIHTPNPAAPVTTSLRNFLRRHDWPQVVHLQEVKIKASDEATQRAVQQAVNKCSRSGPDDGPHYEVRFCLPCDAYNARGFGGKMYGVATIIRDDYWQEQVDRIREVDWDTEGRILVLETKSKLAIWNIYAVNGTGNPYRDPSTGKAAGTRHERKLAVHQALINECKAMESDGWRHILCGDFNVAREPIDGYPRLRTKPDQHVANRADFNEKFFDDAESGLKAVDAFRVLHPKRKRYTWLAKNMEWKSSCDRVDYILLSRAFEGEEGVLVEADIAMTETDRGTSDHVPLWVTLDPEKMKPPSS